MELNKQRKLEDKASPIFRDIVQNILDLIEVNEISHEVVRGPYGLYPSRYLVLEDSSGDKIKIFLVFFSRDTKYELDPHILFGVNQDNDKEPLLRKRVNLNDANPSEMAQKIVNAFK